MMVPLRGGLQIRPGLTMRDVPEAERPRERLRRHGPEALSELELVCCLLGRGIASESVLVTAQRLFARFKTLRGIAAASSEQLAQVCGIGPAKAAQLAAALELSRRLTLVDGPAQPVIDSAEAAAAQVWPALARYKKEHVLALLLDNRHRLIRISRISVGSLSASLVHPREVFQDAIAASAAALILAHNHPSGDPQPSEHDVQLTRRLLDAGRLLGIEVLDHLILAEGGTVSLKALGVIA